jgi:hypothetical protein
VVELARRGLHKYNIVLIVDLLHHLEDETCERLLEIVAQLADPHVVVMEPIVEQTSRMGRWVIAHDRGCQRRPAQAVYSLIERSGLTIVERVHRRSFLGDGVAVLCRPAFGGGGPDP